MWLVDFRYLLAGIALGINSLAIADDSAETRAGVLVEATRQLEASQHAERRAREEFEHLVSTGALSETQVEEFRAYLAALERLTEAHRNHVAHLGQGAASEGETTPPVLSEPPPTEEETASVLDAELKASLSEFDDMLLRELAEAREHARTARSRVAGGPNGRSGKAADGAAAGDGTREDAAQGADAPSRSAQEPGASPGVTTSEEASMGGERRTSSAGSGSESGKRHPPPDIPDGRDDDVVARQLRQAAEEETDPSLREKLWDEYRRYKQGS